MNHNAMTELLKRIEELKESQILQYNKMCAEFLGAIYSEHAETWGFGNAKNIILIEKPTSQT
jgi:hypothetical protein